MRKALIFIVLTHILSACSGSAEYKVGDKGPSGGIIVYAASEPFSCGHTATTMCTYLEAAPVEDAAMRPWSQEENTSLEVSGADGTAIGTGWQNTQDIVAQGNDDPLSSAAAYAEAYEFNGITDWYLPSKDELYEMYEQRALVAPSVAINYWSSTDYGLNTGWSTSFSTGYQYLGMKFAPWGAWPIRAF